MKLRVGTFVSGRFEALPSEQYLTLGAESVSHQVYELRVKTVPMTLAREAQITNSLANMCVEGMRVIAIETGGDDVKLQVTGSPFAWAALIGVLPALIGPLVALVIGVIIAWKIPDWALAIPFVGLGGAIFVYAYFKGRG